MGNVTFRIHPFEGESGKRTPTKIRALVYPKKSATDSGASWTERMTSCLDPIINKKFGCFSPDNTQKATCLTEVLPNVLACLYFGNRGTQYCIPADSELACKGECGFSQTSVERLYGCLNSYGVPPNDCDVFKEDFCDCEPSGKDWNPNINACQCPEGKNDYGPCCSETVCRADYHEDYNCETESCQCQPSYHRLPFIPSSHPLSEFSNQCAEACAIGSEQNNPINYEAKVALPGCGQGYGLEGDMCCSNNECVLDGGTWDGRYVTNPRTKSQCLSSYGVWKITNYNSCPREGHCEYPMCDNTSPVQILDQYQPDGPAWVMPCETCTAPATSPPPPQCETPCKNFCASNVPFTKYEKAHCGTTGTSQDTCICHCTTP